MRQRDPEDFGDLDVRPFLDIAHDQDGPQLEREHAERAADVVVARSPSSESV